MKRPTDDDDPSKCRPWIGKGNDFQLEDFKGTSWSLTIFHGLAFEKGLASGLYFGRKLKTTVLVEKGLPLSRFEGLFYKAYGKGAPSIIHGGDGYLPMMI